MRSFRDRSPWHQASHQHAHCDHAPHGVRSANAAEHERHDQPRPSHPRDDRKPWQQHTEVDVFTERLREYNSARFASARVAEFRGDGRVNVGLNENGKRSGCPPLHTGSSPEPFRHHEPSMFAPVDNNARSSLRLENIFTFLPARSQHIHKDQGGGSLSFPSSKPDNLGGWKPLRIGSPADISFGINSPASSPGVNSPPHHEPKVHVASPASASSPLVKQSRYLREMDRRLILSRLAKGERQAALAKEYNVSRSTICNLLKQRDVVLARKHENPLCRHPKKTRVATTAPTPLVAAGAQETKKLADLHAPAATRLFRTDPGNAERDRGREPTVWSPLANASLDNVVVEVQSRAIALLQTKLHDRDTSDDDFRRSSVRLMRLLLEEAIGSVAAVSHSSPKGHPVAVSMCAVAIGESGSALLDVFRRLEPEVSTGFISDSLTNPSQLELYIMSHPRSWSHRNVLLLDVVVASGEATCSAINLLRAKGFQQEHITVVALFVTVEVVALVQRQYPRVHILTTGVDMQLHHRAYPVNKSSSSSPSRVFLDRFLLTSR